MTVNDAWEYDDYADNEISPTQKEILDLKTEILQLQLTINSYKIAELEEASRRSQNPALKDAWEKYQSVLKLTSK